MALNCICSQSITAIWKRQINIYNYDSDISVVTVSETDTET